MAENYILISIMQEFSDKILAGTKTVEYRKCKPQLPVEMLIYESRGGKHIVGKATVTEVIEDTPENVWNKTKSIGGLVDNKAFYDTYYKNTEAKGKKAYALCLSHVVKFKNPVKLSEIGEKRAPQMWNRITKNQFEKVVKLGTK